MISRANCFRWVFYAASGVVGLVAGPAQADGLNVILPSTAAALSESFAPPVGTGRNKIVSRFGKRPAPLDSAKTEMHEGVDFAVRSGDSVKASRSGKVLFAGFSKAYVSRSDKTEQARLIIIRHSDGTSARYVHLNAIRVRPAQEVVSGHVIGTACESDEEAEPVVHFEIRDPAGMPMNPEKLLDDSNQ